MATATEIIKKKGKPVATTTPSSTIPTSTNPRVNAVLQKAKPVVQPEETALEDTGRMSARITRPIVDTALGVASGIKESFQRRDVKVKEAVQRQREGKQTHAEGVIQTAGQALGLAGDIVYEAAKPLVPAPVKEKIKQGLGKIMETKPVKKVVEEYGEFKEAHPRAAANVEAAANIGSIVPIGKGAQVTAKVGGKVAKAGARVADNALGSAAGATRKAARAPVAGIRDAATRKNINIRRTQLKEVMNQSPVLKRQYERTLKKGSDVPDIIAQNDRYVPKVEDGKLVVDEAVDAVQTDIAPMAEIVSEVIKAEKKGVSIEAFKRSAFKSIEDLKLRGDEYNRVKNAIAKDFAFYEKQYGTKGTIPLEVVDQIKKAKYGEINWNNVDQLSADRAISRAAKETVETNITDADIRAMNKEIGKLYDVQEVLETMKTRAVRGGRLGTGMARVVGAVAGSSGGVLGSIFGSMTAGQLAKVMQSIKFNNPIVSAFAKKLQQERPELFKAAEKLLREKKIIKQLPAGKPEVAPTIFMSPSGKGSQVLPEAAEDASRLKGNIKAPQSGRTPKRDPLADMFYEPEATIPMGAKPSKKGASDVPTIAMGTPLEKLPTSAPLKRTSPKKTSIKLDTPERMPKKGEEGWQALGRVAKPSQGGKVAKSKKGGKVAGAAAAAALGGSAGEADADTLKYFRDEDESRMTRKMLGGKELKYTREASPQAKAKAAEVNAKIDRMASILAKGKKLGTADTAGLRPESIKVAKAIAQVESGGKQRKGASGEFGIFQFMPGTWKAVSKQVTGKVLEQTPENETRVAMLKIQQLLDKGFTPREVALIWNTSLGGAEKPLVKRGVNNKGVKYDSGAYADKVVVAMKALGSTKAKKGS